MSLATTGNGTSVINEDGVSTLTNVNNVIQGEGQIGNNGLTVINEPGGVITANLSTGTLVLNTNTNLHSTNPYGLVNQGLLEANGGTLQLNASVISNAGGTIAAASGGSVVQFVNSIVIQGGTLSTSGGATLGIPGDFFATLDGSTQGPIANTGTFTVANDGQLNILGTINNTGSILVNAIGNNTILAAEGTVTLTGAGYRQAIDYRQWHRAHHQSEWRRNSAERK